jgi:hypothetical protein
MLLLPEAAPLARTLVAVLEDRLADRFVVRPHWLPGATAIGTIGDGDPLDEALDPAVDRPALTIALLRAAVPAKAAPLLADALADREGVLDLVDPKREWRPLTLFEQHALVDVLGDLAALLPIERVRVEREVLARGLNHCEMIEGRIARIRLLGTNGTTLAGRAHALVHELGHALIGIAGPYAASYGSSDYGPFLRPETFDRPCDEEALVRAIADAWLLRRTAVTWTRTWPGAIDAAGRDLDGDELAAFARFRLAQGLGLPYQPILVRKARTTR